MADETSATDTSTTNGANGGANGPADSSAGTPVQARVVAQFIKDLSFEVPDIDRVVAGPADEPNLKLEVNVNARHLDGARFESAIELTARATDKSGVIYNLEAVYAGLFEVQRMPKEALEPFLLVNCPALVFPFLRRLVADLTRESGFPPLMIDPIDFGQLYMQRKREEGITTAAPSSTGEPPTGTA